jgi:aspartyl-tRNA(Asn)/glutamyl-tRNA(Gln) amidotransferase subunit A
MVLSWTLDKLGPIGLTADDCGLVLEAMAGPDPLDHFSSRRIFRYREGRRRKRFRLGVIAGSMGGVADPIRDHIQAAIHDLEEIATIEEVKIPDMPFEEITRTLFFAESASAFEDLIESGDISGLTAPEDRYSSYARTAIPAKDYIRALRLRGIVAREIDRVFSRFDALVGPSRATPATPLDQDFPSAIRGGARDVLGAIGNAAGLPAICVPNGFTEDGLPTGMQFMGRAYGDNTILAVARGYQSITRWHTFHPPDALR